MLFRILNLVILAIVNRGGKRGQVVILAGNGIWRECVAANEREVHSYIVLIGARQLAISLSLESRTLGPLLQY